MMVWDLSHNQRLRNKNKKYVYNRQEHFIKAIQFNKELKSFNNLWLVLYENWFFLLILI